MTTKLRKVEPGMYETPDGRYGVVKIESEGEVFSNAHGGYVDVVSGDAWAIVEGSAKDGTELPGEYRTKADAVAALTDLLTKEGTS